MSPPGFKEQLHLSEAHCQKIALFDLPRFGPLCMDMFWLYLFFVSLYYCHFFVCYLFYLFMIILVVLIVEHRLAVGLFHYIFCTFNTLSFPYIFFYSTTWCFCVMTAVFKPFPCHMSIHLSSKMWSHNYANISWIKIFL